TFQRFVRIALEADPVSIRSADLNGDGFPDLAIVVGNFSPDGLADLVVTFGAEDALILLSKGDGEFERASRIPGTAGSRSVVTADFNLDGISDLAFTTGSFGAGVRVLLGMSGGTFTPAASYDFDGFAGAILTADFNGDGKPDIVANLGSSAAVLHGKGDGTFEPAKIIAGPPAGTGAYNAMAAGDIDGDGKFDLVVATGRGVILLPGNGDGTFRAATPLGIPAQALFLGATDWNRDNRTDLVIANQELGTVSVLAAADVSTTN
ncbi:MAG: VCBS repeat-containing protein, partial [Bryobacteraceae bacterium]